MIIVLLILYNFATVPEEFNYDPVTKTYGEPQRRPEIKSSTIEFIAPSEYMVSHSGEGYVMIYAITNPFLLNNIFNSSHSS